MKKIRITTCEQLEEWLENNNWLDHSVFLDVRPPFKPENPESSEGLIRLKVWASGDIEPGSKRTWHKYIFRATGITQWFIDDVMDWSPDGSLSDELEILEECSGVGFSTRIPSEIFVCCDELEIERLQDEIDTVETWLSCKDYSVTVAGRNLPTPQEWITWFKAENIDVAWRCIYGNAKQAELIPVHDYSGWFLQVIDRIKHNDEGLFFFHTSSTENSFYVHLNERDPEGAGLGIIAGRILGRFSHATIDTGNCSISGENWLKYLNEGIVPEV